MGARASGARNLSCRRAGECDSQCTLASAPRWRAGAPRLEPWRPAPGTTPVGATLPAVSSRACPAPGPCGRPGRPRSTRGACTFQTLAFSIKGQRCAVSVELRNASRSGGMQSVPAVRLRLTEAMFHGRGESVKSVTRYLPAGMASWALSFVPPRAASLAARLAQLLPDLVADAAGPHSRSLPRKVARKGKKGDKTQW